MIPQTYEEWRFCIEYQCGIKLTPEYIKKRLAELNDGGSAATKVFATKYGANYHQGIVAWFTKALEENKKAIIS